MFLNVNKIIPQSYANGPGIRYTIWTQGCLLKCPGCSNLDTWPIETKELIEIDQIVKDIQKYKIDGITLTGGEPLLQYKAILDLCMKIFEKQSIFLLTGFRYSKFTKFAEILKYVDILVTGPYFQKLKIIKPEFRGSTNQKIHLLTDRAKQQYVNFHMKKREIIISKKNHEMISTGFIA